MKVGEAVKALLDMPQDAELVICAHEFENGSDKAWPVIEFNKVSEGHILIEGAWPLEDPTT